MNLSFWPKIFYFHIIFYFYFWNFLLVNLYESFLFLFLFFFFLCKNIILILPKRSIVIYMFYLSTEYLINYYRNWQKRVIFNFFSTVKLRFHFCYICVIFRNKLCLFFYIHVFSMTASSHFCYPRFLINIHPTFLCSFTVTNPFVLSISLSDIF